MLQWWREQQQPCAQQICMCLAVLLDGGTPAGYRCVGHLGWAYQHWQTSGCHSHRCLLLLLLLWVAWHMTARQGLLQQHGRVEQQQPMCVAARRLLQQHCSIPAAAQDMSHRLPQVQLYDPLLQFV
jgi:hypothetical protein